MPSTANIDFETFSTAGYYWDWRSNRYRSISKSPPHGLGAVGAAAYAEHPSTGILSLAYDLGTGSPTVWIPGLPAPVDLFEHIARGGLVAAWNSFFEFKIWEHIAHQRFGWPQLPLDQLRDTMARSYAHSLPGALANACEVLGTTVRKDKDGTRLLNKFSKHRNPTKHDSRLRVLPADEPADAVRLYSYNRDDVRTEQEIGRLIPELSTHELEVWKLDQRINARGVCIDRAGLDKLKGFIDAAGKQYEAELSELTGGTVTGGSEVAKLTGWLAARGTHTGDLQADTVSAILRNPLLPPDVRRVLELRQYLSMSSIKKIYAIERRLSSDGRLRGLFAYQGGDRTGRWAGRGPQPQNLPSSGPGDTWGPEQVEGVFQTPTWADLAAQYDNPLAAVSGSLRGLFTAAPGHDLICSDFSAIEAVVLAELAGESWRQKVFRTHGKIYEMSASKITGIPFEEFERYPAEHDGADHPLRKKIGKVAELASGYGGWIGAWKAFGADKYFQSDAEIRDKILAWRAQSPAIVELWGGQVREDPPGSYQFRRELYGLEGAAVQAVLHPGVVFPCGQITFHMPSSFGETINNTLYCTLPSGRQLVYHRPRLVETVDRYSKYPIYQITYEGWNNDYKRGPRGWMRLDTYGGKLAENVTQAVARDLLAYSMLAVEAAGHPIVLHVHDEIVSEVSEGVGSVAEFEAIMSQTPPWAAGWPVRARCWRGKRYRKD
jgi:DNA polymerase